MNKLRLNKDGNIIVPLTQRNIVSVRGPDATKFLQNLTSQDMRIFDNEKPERAAVNACFLNPKGRVLFDAMIVKPQLAGQNGDEVEYWIDVADLDTQDLMLHMKKYALRKKIAVEDISHMIKSHQILLSNGLPGEQEDKSGNSFKSIPGHFFKII